eukprot:c45084_g1_i1 orf=252-644(+)
MHMIALFCRWCLGSIFLQTLCVLLLLSTSGGTSVGVVYGTCDDNLPSPKKVAKLLRSRHIQKVRILNVDPLVLKAFADTGIEVMVGVQNGEVMDLSKSRGSAFRWVRENVVLHVPATNITAIAVGSEIIT